MWNSKLWLTGGAVLALGLTGVVRAQQEAAVSESAELMGQIQALQQRVQELEGRGEVNWLNERKSEEVKALVREVLADADTRASLLSSGLNAGWEDGFYLSSADMGFVLRIDGRIQARYVQNHTDRDNGDEEERGHELRRANLNLSGQIDSGAMFKYGIGFQTTRDDQEINLDHAWISHDLAENMSYKIGEDKGSFLHEEMISASRQLAAERSLMNEVFTVGRVQGMWLMLDASENLHLVASLNDGSRSGEANGAAKTFAADGTDFAVSARADLLLQGARDQFMDFTAQSDDPTGINVGGAVHWEVGETGDAAANDDVFAWTVDIAAECHGANVFAAVAGLHPDLEDSTATEQDMYGVVLQGGYRISPDLEPFVRYEWIDLDGGAAGALGDDELNIVTFGANYYMKAHAAKVTVDLVWALDPIPGAVDLNGASVGSLGLATDDATEEDQLALRIQFQLLF